MRSMFKLFRQPYVASIGVGGTVFVVLLAYLMSGVDDKTPIIIAFGIAIAQLTKAATSFGQAAPNTAVALFGCFAVGVLWSIAIVGPGPAVAALMDNGLATLLNGAIGLYAALLGAAQDRPRDN